MQTTAKPKNRTRRLVTRVAVAGALVVVPLSALAVPAFADAPANTPSAVAIDRDNHPGDRDGDHRGPDRDNHGDNHGDRDRGPENQPAPGPQLPQLPPTGSAG
ncbi:MULTISPECIES: hypothetical protein [Nocardia]|uniref:Uncharacterized protein n=2 Tax=Nocardia TaxID=1817 RepID=A0A2T2Z5E9_9NOCA|nr:MULTISPECIES: hypothetical protein [Nocardia]MBF6244760.1 hypothetical protein [Nocardia elegans]MBF6451462.1 hypothetical protein [Nocardia elegans]PSR62994.1 hypothetical protein C8259_14875 [Nocardia nova]